MNRNKTFFLVLIGVVVAGLSTLAIVSMNRQDAPAPQETSLAQDTATAQDAQVSEDAPIVGEPAPAFSVRDTAGKTRTLDEFEGRYVVLEWLNHDCPFVKKYYNSGRMQELQSELTKDGVVWLSVNSSREGQQGHNPPEKTDELTKSKNASPSAVLLDEDYAMALAYSAKTTPHMLLIDPQGVVLYNGAIDDKPSTDEKDIEGAKNYLLTAYQEVKEGKAVTTATTQPYGCTVKY